MVLSKENNMNVKGLSIKDIMSIDLDTFNKLSESDLRAITSRLVSASNKRIRRLQEQDIDSPALQTLGARTGFSTITPKGLEGKQRVNYLRQEFAQARHFLSLKTSTLSGAKNMVKKMSSTISEKYGVSLSKPQMKSVINVMNRLKRTRKIGSRGSVSSQKMFQLLSQRVQSGKSLDINKNLKLYKSWADKIYLSSQRGVDIDINSLEEIPEETNEITID